MIRQSTGRRSLVVLFAVLCIIVCVGADVPTVNLASMDRVGPRPLEQQTQTSVIRNYLEAWGVMNAAFQRDEPALLDAYFIGAARRKLGATIHDQTGLNLQTSYKDKSHDIRIVFYSPEGLSIELVDDVEYQVELRDHGSSIGSQSVHAKYIAVLTPTETRWKVRIFQSGGST